MLKPDQKHELERDVEARLGKAVRRLGGLYYKFVSPSQPGVPDRLVVMPHGQIWFVELKTRRGRVSRVQERCIGEMRRQGCRVAVLHGSEEVDQFVTEELEKLTDMGPGQGGEEPDA